MWYLGPLIISVAFCFFLCMGHTFPFLCMYYNIFFWKIDILLILMCFNHVWFFAEPVNSNPPGSFVHGILQAWILEWVAISYSRESSRPRDWTLVSGASCTGRQILYTEPICFPKLRLSSGPGSFLHLQGSGLNIVSMSLSLSQKVQKLKEGSTN